MTVLLAALTGWLALNILVVLGSWYLRAGAAAPKPSTPRAHAPVPAPRTASADVGTPVSAAAD